MAMQKRLVLLNKVRLKIGTHFTMLSMTKMLEYMCTLILHNGTVQQESKTLLSRSTNENTEITPETVDEVGKHC